jgi:hypothetical protein
MEKKLKNKCKEITTCTVDPYCKIEINKIDKDIADVTTKEIYRKIIDKICKRPTSEQKWHDTNLVDITNDDWRNIYQSAFKLTTDTKIQTFQFKITHRILACKTNLYVWNIEDNCICNYCELEKDTIEHHLVMCTDTLEFWNQIRIWWKSITQTHFIVGIYDLIFGLPNEKKTK